MFSDSYSTVAVYKLSYARREHDSSATTVRGGNVYIVVGTSFYEGGVIGGGLGGVLSEKSERLELGELLIARVQKEACCCKLLI